MDPKGGSSKSRTDLLAAGRKKLQQFRKKKDKKTSSKKAEADADAETEEEAANAAAAEAEAEAVQEPKSPVGLALIAGDDGKDQQEASLEPLAGVAGDGERTQLEEVERSGVEQCNGEEPSSRPEEEPTSAENAEAVPAQTEDGGEHNVSTSEEGSSSRESPELSGGEDSAIQVTGADGTSNQVEEAQQMEIHASEKPPDCDLKEDVELLISSQGTSADDASIQEEGAQQMEMDASEKPSDADLEENVEPKVSSEVGVERGHEEESSVSPLHQIPDSIAREDATVEADRVGEEIVQEDPGTTSMREEITTQETAVKDDLSLQSKSTGEMDELPYQEKVESALFEVAVNECILPDEFEDIRRHLYLTTISRDFLQLQLGEQVGLNSEITQRSSDEFSKLHVLVKETEECKVAVSEELRQCRSELQDMTTVKGELELIMSSVKAEVSASNSRCEKLEYELHSSKENMQHTLSDLVNCRALLETLQKDNLQLTANFAFEKEARQKLEEEREYLSSENKKLSLELSELELILASVKAEINSSNSRYEKLEYELHSSKEGMQRTLTDLADCRASLETLQKENLELTVNFTFAKEATKKLAEENEYLSCENKKLSSELLELNDRLLLSYDKHKQLESNITETETYFGQLTEQLIEESLCASSCVDIYQSVIKELDDKCNVVRSQALDVVHQEHARHLDYEEIAVENSERTTPNSGVTGHVKHERSLQLVNEKDSGKSAALQVLKGHLEEAKGDLHDLEKLNQRICSRSDGSVLVSKLIKSFESKGNQADPGMTEGERDDVHKSTRELICRLGERLKEMGLGLIKAEEYVVELCNRRELSTEFEMEYEEQRQQNAILQAKMDELAGKLSNYKDVIDELHNQLDNVHQDADNNAGRLFSQAELLQKELTDRITLLEHERDSLTDLLTDVIDKLSSLSGTFVPNDLSDNEDLHSHALNCVDFATRSIQSVHEKLEAAQFDNNMLNTSLSELDKARIDVQERSEQASGFMKKMCSGLQELLRDSCGNADEAGIDDNAEEPIDVLFSRYERLIEHLQNLLHDRLKFLTKSADLESRLLSKCEEVEELSIRCNSLTKDMNDICLRKEELESISSSKNVVLEELHSRCLALAEKLVGHSVNNSSSVLPVMSESGEVIEKCSKEHAILNSLLPYMEKGIASHIEKYEKAVEQIHLSKVCLQEANILNQISSDKWSLALPTLIKEEILPKMCDLQERMDQLSSLNFQLETEMAALRDGLKTIEGALETSRTEVHQKVSELEQSEQKLSYVKEKLSIAVAKGKGLIVQRDSLKQSLSEKSGELEKLLQELQSKEALLKELEAKLKSYTEVDRIEALESELSYIRNSATALRDSFLLKDSVLQRIEEVLEDLDFPEHFHSRDIVEKIELLSKMAVGSSFPVHDGDKRSSVDGHSDSGAAVMDGLNDDQHSNSNPGSDELKNKYDELQRRFYDLAEHNNILEQSLEERNSLIQKWEEVLGLISIPAQFRMLEPEDRIAWLGKRLSEVERERDALQLKIEHLEDSSEMLIVDLEESHKRISELNAEVGAIKAEKDLFSESLEKLRFEFLGLSEKAVQDEFERQNLRKDVAGFQEKLADKTEESKHYHHMEIEIHELLDLVLNALRDSSTEIPAGDSATVSLGKLLRKLLEDYGTLVSESTRGNVSEKEIHLEETKLSDDASTLKTSIDDKEMVLTSSSNELEDACNSLAVLEQQRDEAVENTQSLMLEMEELRTQINQLQEESADQMQKYQSLVLELELVGRQRSALQEQLNQEEQKCASLREKLNVAVRKGKGLVQHRDSLKQTMEEMNSVIEKLKNERKQHIEALESEKSSLMGRLAENEKSLHDTRQYLSRLLSALNAVDVGRDVDMSDPIAKIEKVANFGRGLQAKVVSSENEVKKSKRATELLLAELHEAQERADILQEELAMAEAALSESSRQNNILEAARTDAVHHLEHFMSLQTQARRKQLDHLKELNSSTGQLRKVCSELSHGLVNTFSKDVDLICYMESFMVSSSKLMDGANMVDIPITSNHLLYNSISSKKAYIPNAPLELKMDDSDESQIVQHLAIACCAISDCVQDCGDLKRSIDEHAFSVDQKATELFNVMGNLQNRFTSQNHELESLRENIAGLHLGIKEKEDEISSMRRNMSLLYEACSSSVAEIEGMTYSTATDSQVHRGDVFGKIGMASSHPSYFDGQNELFADDHIRSVADKLVATIKSTRNSNDGNSKELKATIFELQQELHAKDIQISTISTELTSQIRDAESFAKQLSVDLDNARSKVSNLEKQVEVLLNEKKILESQVSELKDTEEVASELRGRIKDLTDALSSKEQEIEGLMQALDEEEKELEVLENRNNELEQMLQEKEFTLKSLEVSRTKAVTKLATTVDKFDELHNLSESLLAEVENLQSQLQERDSEISFLRQEVTRSTNELLTLEETTKKYSSQINDFLKWLETALLRFGVHYGSTDDYDFSQIPVYMDILDKKIGSVISESDDLRVTLQSKDSLLQAERSKMDELLRKSEVLETSLSQKESQIGLLRRERTSGQPSRAINLPGTSEIEQVMQNDKVSPGAVVTQIRGVRKVNNDQVAIAIEMENDKPLDDEDDDKAHGFKSLTMSHIVPKFTRPMADRIDGMWVSGDRLLMRQPTLRLGVLIYWIALHALLASFI